MGSMSHNLTGNSSLSFHLDELIDLNTNSSYAGMKGLLLEAGLSDGSDVIRHRVCVC